MSERSLGSRVSELLSGKPAWWLRVPRARLRQIFAELLDVEEGDVFGAAVAPPSTLGFPEFPALPPLGRNDEPCRLESGGWLVHVATAEIFVRGRMGLRRWVVAPPGSGKSLTVRYLKARHAEHVLAASVGTLEDAVAQSSVAGPLIVEVERAVGGGRDVRALRALESRHQPTIVLAPFAFPEPSWSGPGATVSRGDRGWEVIQAKLEAGWRNRLLAWLDRRLEETDHNGKFRRADVEEWLSDVDPLGDRFATPGELLALCAEFDAFGPGRESLKTRAVRWSTQLAPTMLPGDAPATWRARGVHSTIMALAAAHLEAAEQAYGHLDRDCWERLLTSSVPRSKTAPPETTMLLAFLEQAGLLRGGAHGLVLYPQWVERGVVRTAQERALLHPDLAWGDIAADSGRREVIDDCLDGLPWPMLMRVARNAAASPAGSLREIGAVDATCAAIARRCATTELQTKGGDADVVRSLFSVQIEHLVVDASYGEVWHPLTRPEIPEWFATAWTLSLKVPPPEGFTRPDLAWTLPGWTDDLSFGALPAHWFPTTHFAGNPSAGVPMPGLVLASAGTTFTDIDFTQGLTGVCPPDVARVAALTFAVVHRMALAPVPAKVPRLLLPALFLSERGWVLGVEHFKRMHGSWEESFLSAIAEKRDDLAKARLAGRFWELAAQEIVGDGAVPVAERIGLLLAQHPGLAAFVLRHVDPGTVRLDAAAHGTHRRRVGAGGGYQPSDPILLAQLPRPARQAALRGWLDGAAARGARFDEARELVPLLDAEDLDLALDLVRASDRFVAAEFTAFVWSTWPDRAREEAQVAVEQGLPSGEGWFHSAPRAELPFLVDLVGDRDRRPAWTAGWARRRLLEAGRAGERLFELLGNAGS